MRRHYGFAVGVLLAGCMSTTDAFRKNGLQKAAFDLQCPSEQLAITPLNKADCLSNGHCDDGATVGVSGCGKQVTYVVIGTAWIENTKGDTKAP